MHAFTDSQGRKWEMRINVATVARLERLMQLDLTTLGEPPPPRPALHCGPLAGLLRPPPAASAASPRSSTRPSPSLKSCREEIGGYFEIASGEMTAEQVREKINLLRYRPLTGTGWRVLIANECDRMQRPAETIWLDALENLPPQTVVIFTTNEPERHHPRPGRRLTRPAFTVSAGYGPRWRAPTCANKLYPPPRLFPAQVRRAAARPRTQSAPGGRQLQAS